MTSRFTTRIPPLLGTELASKRDWAHHRIMSLFEGGLGDRPRAHAGILWHINDSHDELTIQSMIAPSNLTALGSSIEPAVIPLAKNAQILKLQVSVEATKMPVSDVPVELRAELKKSGSYRSKRVPVPESERTSWFERRMGAAGAQLQNDLELSELKYVTFHSKPGRIPYFDAKTTITITDAEEFNKKLLQGLGRGKNYGLGLVFAHIVR